MTPGQLAKLRYLALSQRSVAQILSENSDKNFVQRILNPQEYPDIPDPDGGDGRSTHKMAYGEVDGKVIAFPTIFYDEKKESLYVPKDPVAEALKTKNYIEFKTPQEADWFTQNYKLGMPQMMANPAQPYKQAEMPKA
jgi:hypothetical protein